MLDATRVPDAPATEEAEDAEAQAEDGTTVQRPPRQMGCPQMDFEASSSQTFGEVKGTEDCLRLHVYTPHGLGEDEELLPVMVWIHGGGWVVGDAWAGGLYNGSALALRAKVVVVSIQYRLGLLGFLADGRLRQPSNGATTGNWGLLDQQLALKWVKDNIRSFGGDPKLVTIFGESAGGESVCWHLVAPGSHGLFHRAIMESGSCDASGDWKDSFVRHHWWLKNDPTTCTHFSSADDYVNCLQYHTPVSKFASLTIMSQMYSAGPTVDGSVNGMPKWPRELMSAGFAANKVPVMFGENGNPFQFNCKAGQKLEDCGFLNILPGVDTLGDDEVRGLVEAGWGPPWTRFSDGQWRKVLEAYPLDDFDGDRASRFSAIASDAMSPRTSLNFGQCGTLRSLEAYLAVSGKPGYAFSFDRLGSRTLVGHGDEVPYVFQCPGHGEFSATAEFFDPTSSDMRVAASIGEFWGHFARHGHPGGSWPPYDANDQVVATVSKEDGTTFEFKPATRASLCKMWNALGLPDVIDGELQEKLDISAGGDRFRTGPMSIFQHFLFGLVVILSVLLLVTFTRVFWRRLTQREYINPGADGAPHAEAPLADYCHNGML